MSHQNEIYKEKYLKYKSKYLQLQNKLNNVTGGGEVLNTPNVKVRNSTSQDGKNFYKEGMNSTFIIESKRNLFC